MTGAALLVAGTSSDAGKSLLVAGLGRALRRRGLAVAPFKAQNMSNNSAVVPGVDGASWGEIGRAQAMQAAACGLAPSVRFNPVLLKPGSDRASHVVVRGVPAGRVTAATYASRRAELAATVDAELAALRADVDVVLCEGAGSPAEINLRASDIANLGLARRAGIAAVVVGDIDRGGLLAHLFGTLALLDPDDQPLVAGFIVNKFRGDAGLLQPGLDELMRRTGRPTLGVVPWTDGLWLDAEDSLSVGVGAVIGPRRPPVGSAALSVAAVRLPRVSNTTDVEALACEPGVTVRWVDDAASVVAADLAVLPGSRATLSDLAWIRSRGIADALVTRAAAGRLVLGICGGFQMLGADIDDPVEGGGHVAGLGLLDVDVRFDAAKTLRRAAGTALGEAVSGYEIHHGRVVRRGDPAWLDDAELGPEGAVRGAVRGTHWHGLLACDAFRRAYLADVADVAGLRGFSVAPDTDVDAERERQLDLMGDLVETGIDVDAVLDLARSGAPVLPMLTTSAV